MTSDVRAAALPHLFHCFCGAGCDFAKDDEPCYGEVEVVDVDCPGTDLETRLHGCEGHVNGYGAYTPYKVGG